MGPGPRLRARESGLSIGHRCFRIDRRNALTKPFGRAENLHKCPSTHGRTITPKIVAMDSMSDEEMASKAFVLRRRAEHGDLAALKLAEKLEAELRARLGPTPSGQVPLADFPKPRPWWRFW